MVVRVPGIAILPGITEPAPLDNGRAVRIVQRATVQSTGARQFAPGFFDRPFPSP